MATLALPQCWKNFDEALSSGARIVLAWGPPGTGKSYGGMKLGLKNDQGVYRLPCHADLHEGHLTGQDRPKRGDWIWREGMAVKAWQEGARLVIDEVDLAPQEVRGLLQLVLDSSESARWTHPDSGYTVMPTDGFTCVLTMNGDPSHLPPPILDRVDVEVYVDAVHPSALDKYPEIVRPLISDIIHHGQTSLRKVDAFYRLQKGGLTATRSASLVWPKTPDIGKLLSLA